MKELPFMAHICEKITIISCHHDIEERMVSHLCLEEDIFPEFLRVVDGMEYLFFHPIVRDREIRLKEEKCNSIKLWEESESTVGRKDYVCILHLSHKLRFFLMCIWVDTHDILSWENTPHICLYPLYPDTNSRKCMTMTRRTFMDMRSDIVAVMAYEIFPRVRMICEGDITLRTEWEISTILTDPGSSRSTTIIEEERFFIFFICLLEPYYEFMRNEWCLDHTIGKMYETQYRCHRKKLNTIRAHLR